MDNKKERQFLENLQDQFYHVHQQETTLFQHSLQEVDLEERAFFEERLDKNDYRRLKNDKE